jgi:hypothetical protein
VCSARSHGWVALRRSLLAAGCLPSDAFLRLFGAAQVDLTASHAVIEHRHASLHVSLRLLEPTVYRTGGERPRACASQRASSPGGAAATARRAHGREGKAPTHAPSRSPRPPSLAHAGDTWQFIGELVVEGGRTTLRARLGRNVTGLNLELYERALHARRVFAASVAMPERAE